MRNRIKIVPKNDKNLLESRRKPGENKNHSKHVWTQFKNKNTKRLNKCRQMEKLKHTKQNLGKSTKLKHLGNSQNTSDTKPKIFITKFEHASELSPTPVMN